MKRDFATGMAAKLYKIDTRDVNNKIETYIFMRLLKKIPKGNFRTKLNVMGQIPSRGTSRWLISKSGLVFKFYEIKGL